MVKAGAELSEDCGYRLSCWRIWDEARKPVVFITLMAPIEDEFKTVPETLRCCAIAERLGAGGAVMVPLFGLRAWKFSEVRQAEDPVGPETDAAMLEAAKGAEHVICAWGASGKYRGREEQALTLLRTAGISPKALGLTGKGSPVRPRRTVGELLAL
jgi:hypothetical protein